MLGITNFLAAKRGHLKGSVLVSRYQALVDQNMFLQKAKFLPS